MASAVDPAEADKKVALAIAHVECEFGAYITEAYPLMKFLNQLDYVEFRAKEEEKAARANNRTISMRRW